MTGVDERHAELLKDQIQHLLIDLGHVCGDPEEVVGFVEGVLDRMKRELAEE